MPDIGDRSSRCATVCEDFAEQSLRTHRQTSVTVLDDQPPSGSGPLIAAGRSSFCLPILDRVVGDGLCMPRIIAITPLMMPQPSWILASLINCSLRCSDIQIKLVALRSVSVSSYLFLTHCRQLRRVFISWVARSSCHPQLDNLWSLAFWPRSLSTSSLSHLVQVCSNSSKPPGHSLASRCQPREPYRNLF